MVPHVKVTPELRKEVVSLKEDGLSLSAISKEFGRSKSVISRILTLYNEKKTFRTSSKLGRPRLTTKREDRIIKRYIDKDLFDTAAGISQTMSAFHGKEVSRSTVSRRLNECGYKARSPAVKPLISKKKEKQGGKTSLC